MGLSAGMLPAIDPAKHAARVQGAMGAAGLDGLIVRKAQNIADLLSAGRPTQLAEVRR